MARRVHIAGGILLLAVLAMGVVAPPAALAQAPPAHQVHGRAVRAHRPRPRWRPSPAPSPTVVHPDLILTQADIDAIRARLEAGLQPQSDAWTSFMPRVRAALAGAPSAVVGPSTGSVTTVGGENLVLALDKDGKAARDLALAYALTGDTGYAAKARDYLVAWAARNTPTTLADCGDPWFGSYQSPGAFMFAYAYDLAYDSGSFSAKDMTEIEAWFRTFVDALDTYNKGLASEWAVTHPGYELSYGWTPSRHYRAYDNYVGGDNTLLRQVARLAMARVIGYSSAVQGILDDSGNVAGLESMSKSSLSPRNDGDGVLGHLVPAPQVDVYKQPKVGGGTIDYMTYNTRAIDVLFEMAQNISWDAGKLAALESRLHTTWTYLADYFGPGADPTFATGDTINSTACLPRFVLAYRDLDDDALRDIAVTGSASGYYEPQFLGPVTLTHSIAR